MTAPKKLLIYPAIDDERLAKVVKVAPRLRVVNATDLDAALAEITDAEGFFGKLTAPLLARAERLAWVQSPTASLEHYLFPELIAHPCVLTNMRGLFSDVIAEHVFGMILMFARNLHVYLRQQGRGEWAPCGGEDSRTDFVTGPGRVTPMDRAHRHLADETLGIIGLGAIGREVARIGASFGTRLLGLDPYQQQPAEELDLLLPPEQLPFLLGESDYVVIAAPHTPETAGWIGREQLRMMRPHGILINIGRGAIVRLDDLVDALRAGELGGAGLDVFETEPLPSGHPLWSMENVLITPHVAACSTVVPERHLEVLLDNIQRFACGMTLRNVVDKRLWF